MSSLPDEFSRALIVSVPIDIVRGFLTDFAHAPLWDPATRSCDPAGLSPADPDGGAPARLGSGWRTRSTVAGRVSAGHYRLERGHPHWITITGRHPGLTRTLEFALADLDSHTEIHLTVRHRFHGLTAPARRRWQHRALVELTHRAAAGLSSALESHGTVPPKCVIDPSYQGWRLFPETNSTAMSRIYRMNRGEEGGGSREPRTYRDLAATRGPLRAVVPVSPADVHKIDQLLAEAGSRAVPTVRAAVHTVYTRLRDTHTHLGGAASRSLACQRLTAASAGTQAATALLRHLDQPAPELPADIHPDSRDALVAMIVRWICHPDHYTDPATTFAGVLPAQALGSSVARAGFESGAA